MIYVTNHWDGRLAVSARGCGSRYSNGGIAQVVSGEYDSLA